MENLENKIVKLIHAISRVFLVHCVKSFQTFFIIHKFMRVLFETVWGGPQTDVLDFDGKIELVFPSTNFFPSSKGTIFLLNFEGEKN